MRGLKIAILSLAITLSFPIACSFAPKNKFYLDSVLTSPLRIRRPRGPGADPHVGPGGVDYVSNPLPDRRFDCKKPQFMFKDWDDASIRSCLRSIKKKKKIQYVLVKKAEPYFQLEIDEEKTPKCLIKRMPRIPVPREFFFQSTKADWDSDQPQAGAFGSVNQINQNVECYSSRLPLEEGKILGKELFPEKLILKFQFPLPKIPRSRAEFLRAVVAWSLTPFYYIRDSKGSFEAQVVPQAFCKTCFGQKDRLKKVNSSYPRWPNPSDTFFDEEH